MKREEAIAFLESHQPLPNDAELGKKPELMASYDKARKYFLAHPDPISIPLFLRSFGRENGSGMYQLVEDVLWKHDPKQVTQALLANLANPDLPEHTLYWNTQLCADFSDDKMLPQLLLILHHPNDDIRMAAATALAQIGGNEALMAINLRLSQEQDKLICQHFEEIIADLSQ